MLVLAGAVALAGCVRQTMTVRTNPPGARTFINGTYVGLSPVTTEFDWYTNYSVHVEKPGYQPVDQREAVRAPWYQRIPLDLVAEALPWRVADAREFAYDLAPAPDGVGPPLWSLRLPGPETPTGDGVAAPAAVPGQ